MLHPPLPLPHSISPSSLGAPPRSAGCARPARARPRPILLSPRAAAPARAPAGRRLRDRDRELLAWATRFGRLNVAQAWRWWWPDAASDKPARNRLSELAAAGLLTLLPLRSGRRAVYAPTRAGARAAAEATGGLSAPARRRGKDVPAGALVRTGHDLTVAEVARWALAERARAGAAWRTERELSRERVLALAPHARRGNAGARFRPDGALVLPTGERLAVEVELHDKAPRLGEKLARYRAAVAAGEYAGVWWLTHPRKPAVAAALERALRAAGLPPGVAWAERLPPEVPVWAD